MVTGPPGCGKTTVLLDLCRMLKSRGFVVGGIICPEMRDGTTRVGFEIVDLLGRRGILAHVSLFSSNGPVVSRYGINMEDLDEISREAFSRKADLFIIDEIGPMEMRSRVFTSEVDRILNSSIPVVAAVHFRTRSGFIGRVKTRSDTKIIEIGFRNRDALPGQLCTELANMLRRHI